MRALQDVTFAAQVASRVCVMRTTDFSAWKKDWEDCELGEWLDLVVLRGWGMTIEG
jgi:hypothetical protein